MQSKLGGVSSMEQAVPESCPEDAHSNFLHTISKTLVSVELLTDMRSSRTRQSTRRVILKASITSVILLSIAFIITYSVLLSYISNRAPMMRRHDDSVQKSKSGKRNKLLPRPFEVFGRDQVFRFTKDQVVKWNIEKFIDVFNEKPYCLTDSKIRILITSAPENSDRRNAIRETWCNPSNFNLASHPWQCIFLIGQSFHRPSNIIIESEIAQHHDILIGSYVDSYRNLTVKIMHGLHWVSSMCPSDFVMKTDDDVYVNSQLLFKLLTKNTPNKDAYIGLVVQSTEKLRVIRNPQSKWSVTYEEFAESHYPPYAIGMGYLLSLDVVQKMVNVSRYVVPFSNEDAYIGVLADRIGIEPYRSGRFTLTGSGLRMCNFLYLVVVHHITAEEQYKHFKTNEDAYSKCFYGPADEDSSWL